MQNEQDTGSERPFESKGCVETTFQDFLPQVETAIQGKFELPTLGVVRQVDGKTAETVETRYLTNEGFVIVDVFNRLKAEMESKKTSGWTSAATTDTLKRELLVDEIRNENFGQRLLNEATKVEASILTRDRAHMRSLIPGFEGEIESLALKQEEFKWKFMTDGTDDPRIFMVVEKGRNIYDIVDVDELFKRSPDFVKKLIIDYHYFQNLRRLITNVRNNLLVHTVNSDQLEDTFINSVTKNSELTSAEQIGNAEYFLNRYETMDKEMPTIFTKPVIYADGDKISLKTYLEHLVHCQGIDDSKKADVLAKITFLQTASDNSTKPSLVIKEITEEMSQNRDFTGFLSAPVEGTEIWLQAKQKEFVDNLANVPDGLTTAKETLQDQLNELNKRMDQDFREKRVSPLGITTNRLDELAALMNVGTSELNNAAFDALIRIAFLAKKGVVNLQDATVRKYIQEKFPPLADKFELMASL